MSIGLDGSNDVTYFDSDFFGLFAVVVLLERLSGGEVLRMACR